MGKFQERTEPQQRMTKCSPPPPLKHLTTKWTVVMTPDTPHVFQPKKGKFEHGYDLALC